MAKMQAHLEDENVSELRQHAREAGIANTSHMRKDELVSALRDADSSGSSKAKSAHPTEQPSQAHGDAIALLKRDHANVKALFKEALAKDHGDASIEPIVEKIITELDIHTQIEEKLFYPALKAKAQERDEDEAADEVLEAYVEHDSVKTLIEKIKSSSASDESYKALVQVMSEQVEHHVEEEESEMFKQAKKLLGNDELRDLGRRMQELKEQSTPELV